MPVPMGAAGVVLFGGSFDPPTRAHVEVASRARDAVAEGVGGVGGEAEGVWLVFVPAGRSPFKGAAGAGDTERVEMVRLAARGIARAGVWTDEIDRAAAPAGAEGSLRTDEREPSYWVETVWRARGVLSVMRVGRVWFLIGADQAVAFHRWREAREIVELATPIVVLREPVGNVGDFDKAMAACGYWSEDELRAWHEAVVDIPMRAGSATAVRDALRSEVGAGVLEDLLDPEVLGFIRERGLYEESGGG